MYEPDDARNYVTVTIRYAEQVDELGLGFLRNMLMHGEDVTYVHVDYAPSALRKQVDRLYAAEVERQVANGLT